MKAKTKHIKIGKSMLHISLVLFAVSLVLKLSVSSRITVLNSQLSKAIVQKEGLEKQITELSARDTALASIRNVEDRALALGFVHMQESLVALDMRELSRVASIFSQ